MADKKLLAALLLSALALVSVAEGTCPDAGDIEPCTCQEEGGKRALRCLNIPGVSVLERVAQNSDGYRYDEVHIQASSLQYAPKTVPEIIRTDYLSLRNVTLNRLVNSIPKTLPELKNVVLHSIKTLNGLSWDLFGKTSGFESPIVDKLTIPVIKEEFNKYVTHNLKTLSLQYTGTKEIEQGTNEVPNVKENAWKRIAELIERPVVDFKKRWGSIKDAWQKRQENEESAGRSSDSGAKKWSLADLLPFLNKMVLNQESISNVPSGEGSIPEDAIGNGPSPAEDTQPQIETDTSIPKRRGRRERHPDNTIEFLDSRLSDREAESNRISEEKPHEDDDVDLFFKSIARSVKKLRSDLINEAKSRTLQMIIEMENRNAFEFPEENSGSPRT